MFKKGDMSIGDWWVYFLLMAIPFVNIVVFLIVLLSSNTNKSLKNFVLASIIPAIIIVILFFTLGFSAILLGNA